MRVHFVRRLLQHLRISRHTRNGTQGLTIFPVVHVGGHSSQNQVLRGMNCFILDIRPFLVSCVSFPFLRSLRSQGICDTIKVKNVLLVCSVTNHSSKTSILSSMNEYTQENVLTCVSYAKNHSTPSRNSIDTCVHMSVGPS